MERISPQGLKLMQALGAERVVSRNGQSWSCGLLSAPDSVVVALERGNLVARAPGGRLRLTPAGEAWCGRRGRRRTSPNRVLVERSLPQGDESEGAARRSVTVNLAESPLGWLMSRGQVTERQFLAGERLRADWTVAGLAPRVTMRWDAAAGGTKAGPGDPADATLTMIAARKRFDAAVAQAGEGLADVLWRVICAGEGLATAEAALGWPKRSAKLVLGLALDRVADFYGIG